MYMCKRRVLRYAQEYDKLPSTLGETKTIEGYDASIKDGWGVELAYSADTNFMVTLRSFGKDRAPGGVEDDMDIIGIFPAKQPDGSWSDEFVDWIQDSFYTSTQGKANKTMVHTR